MSKDDATWRAGSRALAQEARDRMAARHRPPSPSVNHHAAASKIVSARMVSAELQPQTIAYRDIDVVATDVAAMKVGKDGEERTEASKTLALFDRSACAVFRLAHDGLVEFTGVQAALAFAAAGDRVMGGDRVRTVDFDRVPGGGDGGTEAEKSKIARHRWDVAVLRLMRAQFRILDGVMRHDESVEAAGRAAYPKIRNKMKIIGMADQALIDACAALAVEYGFEKIKHDVRPLAGL